jgi:hypothetical protein
MTTRETTIATQRLLTDSTAAHGISTLQAEGAFTIDTGGGQTRLVGKVAMVTQERAFTRLTAYRTHQRLQTMQQRIPHRVRAPFGRTGFNADRQDELGLDNDQKIEQGEIEADLITLGNIGEFGGPFCRHRGQLVL